MQFVVLTLEELAKEVCLNRASNESQKSIYVYLFVTKISWRQRKTQLVYDFAMNKLLLIDDDERHSELLKSYLQQFNIDLVYALDGESGLQLFRKINPDLLLLDIMLPGKDGFEICREIRKTSNVPIIILTARGDVIDRVSGLELGADDYVGKPFEPRELVARIQSILRRVDSPVLAQEILQFDGMVIDKTNNSVRVDNEVIRLTTMETQLLTILASQAGKKLSRDEILNQLKGIDAELLTRSVDIMVSRIRQKIKDTQKPSRFIQTVWGFGYVFVGRRIS